MTADASRAVIADPGIRLRPGHLERRDVIVMLVHGALVIALAGVPLRSVGLLTGEPVPDPITGSLLLLVAAAATLWRRRIPWAVLAVTGLLSAVEMLWHGQLAAYILLFEALWSPIVHGRRLLARTTTALGILLSLGVLAILATQLGPGEGLLLGLLVIAVVVLTPLLWGWDVRLHRTAQLTAESLAEAEKALASERSGRAVESDRRQIAQDLHDLVAGHLSAVSLHASLAAALPDGEGRSRSLSTTQDSARAALRDLRGMIEVLTAGGAGDLPEPTISWSELSDRLHLAEEAAEVHIDPAVEDPAVLAPATRAALLRIAAEAVTNALRHGRGPRGLHVTVPQDPEDPQGGSVLLRCTNHRDRQEDRGTGLGLDALDRRSRAVGGVADAGPDPADPGRWIVSVRLPLGPMREELAAPASRRATTTTTIPTPGPRT